MRLTVLNFDPSTDDLFSDDGCTRSAPPELDLFSGDARLRLPEAGVVPSVLDLSPFTDDLFPVASPTRPEPSDLGQSRDEADELRPAGAERKPDGPTLLADMDTTALPARPALLRVEGTGEHLLYPRKVNVLFGGPGTGKSHLAMLLLHQQALGGASSLFLDYEKSAREFVQRANEHAVPSGLHGHLAYWRPNRSLAEIQGVLLQYASTLGIATVVIDGAGQALACGGIDESDNGGVADWFRTSIEPLVDAGLTVVLIDHSGHAQTLPGRAPHPVGASAKMRYTTGTLLHLAPGKAFSQDVSGHAVIRSLKDNGGTFAAGQSVAEFHVTADPSSGSTFQLLAPATGDDLAHAVLRCVLAHTAAHGRGPSKNEVRHAVGHSEEARAAAIDALVADKRVTITKDGNAHRLTATDKQGAGNE